MARLSHHSSRCTAVSIIAGCFVYVFLGLAHTPAIAATIVSHNFDEKNLAEGRPGYELEILILSLEKTRASHGDYRLVAIRDDMNHARQVEVMKADRYTNFIRAFAYDETLEQESNLLSAPFPVFLGVLNYRTCFVSEKIKDKVAGITTKEELLTFSQGLVKGWTDSDILKHNGFRVMELGNYYTLFKMVAINRFDLFCRGANEVLAEYSGHRDIVGLEYDRSMAIYYPLPHFFYGNKADIDIIDRVAKGLQIAHDDGSLYQVWKNYFQESVDFSGLGDRKIFYFTNPHVKNIDTRYERYILRP